ncbi:P pilus assembly protein, chaperone PapD [Calothrix sp. HK-06]|nr:P pilus assembly protein, chaperone PapD [Calothrix sp. HK-06]
MLYKKQLTALGLIGTIALSTPQAVALEVGVSPPKFEIEMNGKGRSQSLKIMNLSSEPVEMQAYVKNWTLNEQNKLQVTESSDQSLDQWIVFTPARFVIPPRSSQNLRFAIRPKVKPKDGEHRAVIYLEEVLSNRQKNSQGLTTIGRLGVVVYAYSGDIKRASVLNSINVDVKPNATNAIFDISSTGNASVRMKGQYAIWRAGNYPGAKATQVISNIGKADAKLPANILEAGELQTTPVLPGTKRQLVMPITKKLPPGNYVLDINGDLNNVGIDKGIPFTIPANVSVPQQPAKPVLAPKK